MEIESEEFLKALMEASPAQISELVECMEKITVLLGNDTIRKLMVRKFEQRLSNVEKNAGVHNTSTGENKWPSLSKQI